jgi:hypothetical protein
VQLARVTFTLIGPDDRPSEEGSAEKWERSDGSARFRFNGLLDYTAKLIEKELPEGYSVVAEGE